VELVRDIDCLYRTIASTIRGGSAPAHPSVLTADITAGPREATHFDENYYLLL
jgi:hypothetical protein